MAGRLLLLDTASLYYRAFFGLPDSFRAADGTVVNAIRGILDFTATLTRQYESDLVVACWDDDWRPQWRVDLIPSYKAQRVGAGGDGGEEAPDELTPQVPLIAEILPLVGVQVVGAAAAEADDVIGTLAQTWDGPVDIVTGDRDLFQLVDDARARRVLYTARGVSKHDVVDAAWVRERYGIDPERYVDFAVLRGDASDGLPGVAGIGDKTAASLLASFGDLDGILAAAHDPATAITPRPRRSLQEQAAYIAAAREVVAVRRDLTLSALSVPRQDPEAARAFGERWSVATSVERALEALSRS